MKIHKSSIAYGAIKCALIIMMVAAFIGGHAFAASLRGNEAWGGELMFLFAIPIIAIWDKDGDEE